jgi:hypothetical protein
LAALGSGLSIVPDNFDAGYNTATGAQIAAHPLNAGVTAFSYAAPSQVAGGTTLYFGSQDRPFIATEFAVAPQEVPEPASLAVWGLVGAIGLWQARRRRRSS